ncbi:uncharacterized protein A1O9_11444, partial [Exophiala aquamarina CBS 119918]
SSPPSYDEYSPPNSQGRSLTEPTTTDQKFKRRRLDLDSNPHSLPDPMHLMNAPVYPPGPRTYMTGSYMPPTTNFGHYASSPPAYWDEEAALEYLASGNGFVQDVRLVVAPTPSVHYQPQHHPTSASQPPATEATPHHPGSSQLRHASNIPAPATNLRPPVLESYQQIPNHPWPAAHSTHYAPGTDASSFANDPRELSRLMNLTASLRPPSHAFCPIEATSSTANQIKLVLSRATQESIDALPEHKRECPACQLDFERDNFMAIISCCNTAMHATCLSAWVNSATYAKSKTCMKCRRAIDARRPLNAVVPPVNDQIWDEGVDLDAPEAIKGDQKIEVLVNPRADRGRRYMRNAYAHYRSTSIQIPENMPPGPRRQLAHLQQEQASEFDGVRRRLRGMMANGNRLTKEESLARRGLAEAQVDVRQGGSSNLEALNQKCEAIKRQKDQWCQDVRSLQRVLEGLPRNHERRVAALIENAM